MMSSAARTPRTPPPGDRLPRGPHSLTRTEVAANQRERIVAAMGELVGQQGYANTTVSDVTAQAGVSRKAFYEHFSNKQECFLETYDTIVAEGRREIVRAYSETENLPDRAGAAITALFERVMANPGSLRIAIVEVGSVGPAGIARRERLMADYEQLLRETLGLPRGAGTIPNPVLRGIVGGLNSILYTRAQSGELQEMLALIPDLVAWAVSYSPAPQSLTLQTKRVGGHALPAGLGGGRAPGTLATIGAGGRRGLARGKHGRSVSHSLVVHNQRERILDAVANLAAQTGYAALTVEAIVERAAVSLQAFYEHFSGKEDAFLVAYELGHAKSLSTVERAFMAEPDWRLGVRAGIAALFDFLASEPAFAQLALVDSLTATRRTVERATDGVAAYAELLVPGLQEASGLVLPPAVTLEAIAGGLSELCLTYALMGRIADLRELLPRAAYFALAPLIGPEQAGEIASAPYAS
jgi:AcrR family transcriptional regulator